MSRYAQVTVVEWSAWSTLLIDFRRAWADLDLDAMRVLVDDDGVATEVAMEDELRLVLYVPGWFARMWGAKPCMTWSLDSRELLERGVGYLAVGGGELPCRTGGFERADLVADRLAAQGDVEVAEAFRAATGSMGHDDLKDIAEGITPLPPDLSRRLADSLAKVEVPDDCQEVLSAAREACKGLNPRRGLVFFLEV